MFYYSGLHRTTPDPPHPWCIKKIVTTVDFKSELVIENYILSKQNRTVGVYNNIVDAVHRD